MSNGLHVEPGSAKVPKLIEAEGRVKIDLSRTRFEGAALLLLIGVVLVALIFKPNDLKEVTTFVGTAFGFLLGVGRRTKNHS